MEGISRRTQLGSVPALAGTVASGAAQKPKTAAVPRNRHQAALLQVCIEPRNRGTFLVSNCVPLTPRWILDRGHLTAAGGRMTSPIRNYSHRASPDQVPDLLQNLFTAEFLRAERSTLDRLTVDF